MRSNLKQMQAKTSTESEMKRTQDIMKIDCERASSSMQQQHFRAQMRNDCKNVKKKKIQREKRIQWRHRSQT